MGTLSSGSSNGKVDDDLAILYREGVLGKEVWIKFSAGVRDDGQETLVFYHGTITRMESYFPEDDGSKSLQYHHYISFKDGHDNE
jgi:hypothetical protein